MIKFTLYFLTFIAFLTPFMNNNMFIKKNGKYTGRIIRQGIVTLEMNNLS
jgi:hypothetical protein